jgi:hypothetical protein
MPRGNRRGERRSPDFGLRRRDAMNRPDHIWNVTIKTCGVLLGPRTLIILAGEKIESAMPKAQKLLREINQDRINPYQIVKVEAAGTVDAF